MKRTDNTDGSYVLTADAGSDLAILDEKGSVIARAKEVLVPPAGTLNVWTEVAEEIPESADSDPEKEARISKVREGIRQTAAAESRFAGMLTPEEEKLMREIISEYV